MKYNQASSAKDRYSLQFALFDSLKGKGERKSSSPAYADGEMTGIIRRPREKVEIEKNDAPEMVTFTEGDLTTGVIASSITLNAMSPFHDLPTTWDVFSTPVALIDSTLTGLRLPNPRLKILSYIDELYEAEPDPAEEGGDEGDIGPPPARRAIRYDEQCMYVPDVPGLPPAVDPPTRQRLPGGGDYRTYCIQARAICINPTLDFRAKLQGFANVDLITFAWSGPFQQEGVRVGTVVIEPHELPDPFPRDTFVTHTSPGGAGAPSVEIAAPDPAIIVDGPAIFDLLFVSIDGGRWMLYVTRER